MDHRHRDAPHSPNASSLSLNQLILALEGMQEAILIQDAANAIVFVNESAARLCGFPSAAAMRGLPLATVIQQFDLLDEAGTPFPLAALPARRVLAGEAMAEAILRWRVKATGEERWIFDRATPIPDTLGNVQFVLGIFRDITGQKRAEEEARASEARYRGLFEGVADAVLIFDAEGRYIDVNEAATVIYGESRAELLQRRIGSTPAMREESLRNFAQLTREGTFRGETLLHRRDGTTVPVESRTTAVHLPDGTIYVTVMRDISERARAEEERQQFVATVVHELRNPLSSLIGYAELLKRRECYDGRAIETILTQGKRIERLTLDLRESLRVEAGTLALRCAPVDVAALVRAAVEQALITTTAHVVHVEIPDDLPTAGWDADRVAQVLGNLLLNAIQYTPKSGVIQVHVRDAGDTARIAIRDAGMGIPPEALPRIFEPFYRAPNAQGGSARGMGLGLPIAKALVEAHRGTLHVESTLGMGTTFTVVLPYVMTGAQES
jgi:PAS domain S-box-containing protein